MLPSAKVEKYKVGNTVYEGANPVYFNTAEQGHVPNIVKVAKGVPFRRITKKKKEKVNG